MGIETAIIGSAVLGAAATAHSVNQQKKAARQQKRRLEKQETAAKEKAALASERDDTGAEFSLGRSDDITMPVSGEAGAGGATTRPGAVGARVGGLGKAGNGVGGAMKRAKRPSASLGL